MKTVLITGANRGIGLATAKLLKKRKKHIQELNYFVSNLTSSE